MKKLSDAAENRQDGRLFNFRPALFAAAFFALGILFARARLFSGASCLWLLPGFFVPVLAPVFFPGRGLRSVLAAFALLLCSWWGALSFWEEVRAFSAAPGISGECVVVGTVEEKEEFSGGARLLLSGLSVDGEKVSGKLVASLPAEFSDRVKIADRVVLTGRVETDLALSDDYGFRSENVEKSIFYRAEAESLAVADRSENVFLNVRRRIRDTLYGAMDEQSAAVTYALLIGDTSGIEAGLLENVRYGGIAHIFSVSGLHVGALYAFVRMLTEKTGLRGLPKLARLFSVSLFILFYAGVCGFSASVVRAAVMCFVLYASFLLGIKSDLVENTGIAALVLLAVHPVQVFDLGFQLSFAACLSIGLFSRFFRDGLDALLPGKRPRAEDKPLSIAAKFRRDAVSFFSVTLSAQVGTAPLLLNAFGYLSVWSLFLNCLFVPLVGAFFAVLLAIVLIACFLPSAAASVLLYVPSVLWSAALLLFHAVDFAPAGIGKLSGGALAAYYAFFVVLSGKINFGKRGKFAAASVFLAAFALSLAFAAG